MFTKTVSWLTGSPGHGRPVIRSWLTSSPGSPGRGQPVTRVAGALQDVDQSSGEDLNPARARNGDVARNPDRPCSLPLGGGAAGGVGGGGGGGLMGGGPGASGSPPRLTERKAVKRVSSPERWELKQMIAANVLDVSELPEFDDETGLLPRDDDSGGERARRDSGPTPLTQHQLVLPGFFFFF